MRSVLKNQIFTRGERGGRAGISGGILVKSCFLINNSEGAGGK